MIILPTLVNFFFWINWGFQLFYNKCVVNYKSLLYLHQYHYQGSQKHAISGFSLTIGPYRPSLFTILSAATRVHTEMMNVSPYVSVNTWELICQNSLKNVTYEFPFASAAVPSMFFFVLLGRFVGSNQQTFSP